MQKVLFLSSRPIYPIMGGDQIRAAQQLEFLVQRYKVDVIYQAEYFVEQEEPVSKYQPSINKAVCFSLPKWKSYLHTLRFLCNRLPLQVNYYYDSRIKRYIEAHCSEYDFVFCNNIRTAEYVRKLEGVKRVIDFVDAISMNYEKAQKQAHGFKRLIYAIDHKRCLHYEQEIFSSFDRCAIISEVDKQYILRCQQNSML